MRRLRLALCTCILAACGPHRGALPTAPVPDRAPTQTGTASWYGPGFQGKQTSSGEVYDQNLLTAAHKTLPLGTRVRVTNVANGKAVDVRINDRGPFVGDRIIDLSRAAAEVIGMVAAGTALVRVDVLETPVPIESVPRTVHYALQAGSFTQRSNADDLASRLGRTASDVSVVKVATADGDRYRVLIGNFISHDDAAQAAARLKGAGVETLIVER
ncbi:MAG TPA: septal ring lytic transglycosylase RlpA family protein [Gemmatimonadaceae bacterium]|nr:septal ring lytic transglycosylase RlpA family protein [Gemmatimonadaceae bacterium]